jgi:hypothetical protein
MASDTSPPAIISRSASLERPKIGTGASNAIFVRRRETIGVTLATKP